MKMITRLASALAALFATALPVFAQQNWVLNGDFASGLTSWTTSGAGDQPLVENFDVTGLGPTAAFGVNAGAPLNSTVLPPYVLQQNLVLPATYFEVHAELCMDAPGFNNDAGTVSIWVGGVERARHAWGAVATTSISRTVICERFLLTSGGPQSFEVRFDRSFASLRGRTPRLYIDNVALRVAAGPSFAFFGDRKPGLTTEVAIRGNPSTAVGVFLAPKSGPALTIPGFAGSFTLDLATTVSFYAAVTDAAGRQSAKFQIPGNLTALQGVSLFYQAVEVSQTPAIGIAHDYGLQK
ncbi:MAG TPA: hypothetical protein PKE00_13760 [Planctomycetota bacterium]|nr:hypothetical protein [Planctomycetota bacterium]